MTASHLCEYENWPGPGPELSGRRPTPYLLALLAAVYNCGATDLIDWPTASICSQHTCLSSTNTAGPRTPARASRTATPGA